MLTVTRGAAPVESMGSDWPGDPYGAWNGGDKSAGRCGLWGVRKETDVPTVAPIRLAGCVCKVKGSRGPAGAASSLAALPAG